MNLFTVFWQIWIYFELKKRVGRKPEFMQLIRALNPIKTRTVP